jgi:hypothetical protein
MSLVKISGNASGTGTLTIAAPNTNTNYTLTLPQATTTIVGTDATQTLTNKTIQGGAITSGTAVASTSGTSIDFTGIPSWAKRITVMFSGVSLSGTSDILVQLGDAGGFETTGYLSTCSAMSSGTTGVSTSTAGMIVRSAAAASVASGIMTIQNLTGNSWVAGFSGKQSATAGSTGGGDKTLSDTLTQLRITTVNGTDTFDAGTINIMYE